MRRAARESNNPMKNLPTVSIFTRASRWSTITRQPARRATATGPCSIPAMPHRARRSSAWCRISRPAPSRHWLVRRLSETSSVCVCSLRLLTRDQGDKGHVVVCGAGTVVTKTISCAELVKRRVLVCVYDACCWLDNDNNAPCFTTGPAPKHADIHGDSGRHVGAERRRPEGPQPVGRCVVSKHVCKVTTTWQDQHDQAHSGSLDPPLAHGT